MTNVEHIKNKVRNLNPEELTQFRTWFQQFDTQHQNEQIEEDQPGNLDKIVDKTFKSIRKLLRLAPSS